MFQVTGFVWLVGNSRPIFVKHNKTFDTLENANSYVQGVKNIFNQFQEGVMNERTITVCNTLFRLESIEALSLEVKEES